jgi:hypothetical protein
VIQSVKTFLTGVFDFIFFRNFLLKLFFMINLLVVCFLFAFMMVKVFYFSLLVNFAIAATIVYQNLSP